MTATRHLALQFRQQVDTVAIRQSQIEQDQIEGTFPDPRQAFFAGRCGIDLVAFKLQQSLQ